MSENAEALDVIREEAGEEAYKRICWKLVGSIVRFPYRQEPPIGDNIKKLLMSGYSATQISRHLSCDYSYVCRIRREMEGSGQSD